MSVSVDALKIAVEFEKMVRDKYQEAVDHAVHDATKESLKKYIADKDQQIDSLHWIIMAEAGKLETTEEPPPEAPKEAPVETGATRLAQGKCPFSREELSKMGFPLSEEKPHA
ncbi:MAG: hypothetical protein ACE5GQ_01000 [Nitrospinales bacterium]